MNRNISSKWCENLQNFVNSNDPCGPGSILRWSAWTWTTNRSMWARPGTSGPRSSSPSRGARCSDAAGSWHHAPVSNDLGSREPSLIDAAHVWKLILKIVEVVISVCYYRGSRLVWSFKRTLNSRMSWVQIRFRSCMRWCWWFKIMLLAGEVLIRKLAGKLV